MTIMQQAIEKLNQLPPAEQESFGAFILHELDSEQRWNDLFARSQDMLAKMGEEALAELRAGRTQRLDAEQ